MELLESMSAKSDGDKLRKMVSIALGVAMRTTLKNHIFTLNGEVRKQKNGGELVSRQLAT